MNNGQKVDSVVLNKPSITNNDVKHLLDILLNKELHPSDFGSEPEMEQFLNKYDLLSDNEKVDNEGTLSLKAGEVLETEGLLSHGTTERLLRGEGYDIDKIRGVICKQEPIEAKSVDTKIEKEVAKRLSTPDVDRLLDIYRNGLSEADRVLSNMLESKGTDLFLWDTNLFRTEDKSIEFQKGAAWDQLVDYMADLRPGMLSDSEVVSLVKVHSYFAREGREIESNLLHLPKELFPTIEKSKEFDEKMVDYVKVIRGIGPITQKEAFQSMDYFLLQRFHMEWDPMGADDEFGRVVGCYYYPNEDMKNPADKFSANLLSEQQCQVLKASYPSASHYLPEAFDKNRISEVQIYSLKDGGMAIRCKIDDEQQSSKVLLNIDTIFFNEQTDRKELAKKYFAESLQEEKERDVSFRR